MSNKNAAGSSKILLRMGNVKYRMSGPGKSPVGTLTIYDERVEWSCKEIPDNLVIHFSKIKVQRISPPNKPKVQLQVLMNGDEQATFVFMNVKADQKGLIEERDKVKEALQSALVQYRQKSHKAMAKIEETGTNEMKGKQKILQENILILSLYKNLVKERLITPQDFWSLHYTPEEKDKEENVGISAGFLSSLIQSAEGVNGIHLRVTSELIQTIFRTYPAVERKHIELVPHEMQEAEFWAKFFQSHYFHRERAAEVNAKDPFSDCIKMDETDMQDIIQKGESHLKRTLNLGSLADDFGIFSEMRLHQISLKTNSARTSLVRRCNYHSERILSTIRDLNPELPKTLKENSEEMEGIITNKQNTKHNGVFQPFDLDLDSQELFEFQTKKDMPAIHIELQATAFDVAQSKYSPKKALEYQTTITDLAKQSILNENTANAYYDSLFEMNLDEEMEVDEKNSEEKSLFEGIDQENEDKIRIIHECVIELLKHFWLTYPPLNPEMEEKMEKVIKSIEIFEKSKVTECERKYGSRYVDHCKQMLAFARTAYSNYMLNRS